jgi:excinuclease ABC subunit C
LPQKAGVYRFLDESDNVLYVGKANDLKSRVSSYFTGTSKLGPKTRVLVSQIKSIKTTEVESELEALLLEAFYIKKFNPKYNIRLTDNKSYIRIRITIKDAYPKVLLARREDDKNSIYFGPYPSAGSVRLVLKTVRRIFPFQSVLNHPPRICLFNHLGLCPCPPINDSPELRTQYKKNIRGLVRILEGESQKIMKELEKERDAASKKEEFEKALSAQNKIKALSLITTPFHRPFEYHVNPNLRDDIRHSELVGLQTILQEYGLPVGYLERIECYDISNTQGTHATGSMVVFKNGEKDSSQYRKFRIRRDWEKPKTKAEKIRVIPTEVEGSHSSEQLKDSGGGRFPRLQTTSIGGQVGSARNDGVKKPKHLSNDFAMMKEVLKRRLNHDEWNTPSLIIIDGGKGQVSAAMTAMIECGMEIPLVGLAKREETIVIPKLFSDVPDGVSTNPKVRTYQDLLNLRFAGTDEEKSQTIVVEEENFTEISLPKNSPSLHLIQRLRNEAHRFAITYHRKLRSKSALADK